MQVESGLGLEAQKYSCIQYAQKFGHEVSQFYIDEGYSSALPVHKRPSLMQAVAEIEKDDILLVAKRDRLGRDVLIIGVLEDEIRKKQAKVISCSGEGTQDDEPCSLLMRRMIDSFAEFERHIIKARTKAAMAVKKRRNERVGYIPYGYKLAENGVNIVANEEEINMITMIICMRQMGYTFRKISSELNFEGKLNRGKPWLYVSVFNLLSRVKLEKYNNL
jgi:DNA invertase Pin-like site-specific DNA recombinase